MKESGDRKKKFGKTGGLAERGKLIKMQGIHLTPQQLSSTPTGLSKRGPHNRLGNDNLPRPVNNVSSTVNIGNDGVMNVEYYNGSEEGRHIMTPLEMQVMEASSEQVSNVNECCKLTM
ncbi:hypothetical protein TL16_g03491 [Triparma laevis f. inornata]|uniref:Uncharacterized protein n=1 Tax=Triparma laevis f. inornata TaxID=1714386 RepID=A0A9W6ZZ14_9STRA|nr:hypothetical protein TL16_g03491 [Triparma laevis f. inornata]